MNEFTKIFFEEASQICKQIDYDNVNNLVNELCKLRESNGRLFILGVGGSAGNASHAVNDFRKLCQIEAYAPTDNVSELTARTNDEGWGTIFENWLKVSNPKKKDGILIFSVGGGNEEKNVSTNLINAIKLAKKMEMKVFCIVGRPDGFAFQNSDIRILIPNVNDSHITPIQSFQAVIWHCLVSHPKLQTCKTKW